MTLHPPRYENFENLDRQNGRRQSETVGISWKALNDIRLGWLNLYRVTIDNIVKK